MSTESSRSSPRYCTGCGAQVRSGDSFCTSCGASLAPGGAGCTGQAGSSTIHRPSSPSAALGEAIQAVVGRLGRARAYSGDASINVPRGLLRRIKDLPIILKVAGAVVGALLLLTVLSPLGLVVTLLLFGVSLVVLIARVGQRRSVKGWGVVAVTSLVLMLVFAGTSSALYGEAFTDRAPDYSVEDRFTVDTKGGNGTVVFLFLAADYSHQEGLDEGKLRALAEDVSKKTNTYDAASVTIYDEDLVTAEGDDGLIAVVIAVEPHQQLTFRRQYGERRGGCGAAVWQVEG